jgi:hypothetical protein
MNKPIVCKDIRCNKLSVNWVVSGWSVISSPELAKYIDKYIDVEVRVVKVHRRKNGRKKNIHKDSGSDVQEQ